MPEPSFDIRPSVLVGDTADISLHRSLTVLRNEGVNPVVSMEFSTTKGGVFCGIREVKTLLAKILPQGNREVWALDEGAIVSPTEVALRVTAPYGSFGLYETAISGTLSQCSGWATASKECVTASDGTPVISVGARHIHPNIAGIMDYSAIIGGCVSCSTSLGAKLAGSTANGTLSPNVSLIMEETLRAMQAFDKHVPQEIPRVAPVSIVKDEMEESLGLAKGLRQRLRGVLIDSASIHGGVTTALTKEIRARLDLAGHTHIEIFLTGGLDPQTIHTFVEQNAPVNGFEVGSYISGATPQSFTADIHEVDGKAVAKRGRIPGKNENPRLIQII